MKAVVLHQPYATLVALGVKGIETRPSPPNGPMRPAGVRGLPGLPIEAGERIAIVAGKRRPKDGLEVGRWTVDGWRDAPHEPCMILDWDAKHPVDLPLGAVVCTVVVAEALPMVDGVNPPWLPWMIGGERGVGLYRTEADIIGFHPDDPEVGGWARFSHGRNRTASIDDQLPFGEFAPGRWGWLLTDVEPCAPVPVKGRQGVFALPDDVAAQIATP